MRMGMACKIAGHKWDGCICARCGAKRCACAPASDPLKYGGHDWDGCVCRRCGALRRLWDEEGSERDSWHDWDGCRCRKCRETRDEGHVWDGCKCKACGKVRDEGHVWDGCMCRACGKKRDEGHRYVFVRSEIDSDYGHVETPVYRCEKCGGMSYGAPKDLGEL